MKARWQTVKHFAGYLCVRMLICVVQALSLETCASLAEWLAVLAADVLKVRRKVVMSNLEHAFPEKTLLQRQALARGMWRHLFLLTCESLLARRKVHKHNWKKYLKGKGLLAVGRIRPAQPGPDEKRAVVMVSAHLGNFELNGYILGFFDIETHGVARTLDNPFLDRFVNRFRKAYHQHIIPKDGGGEQVISVLEAGGLVGFLADQYGGQKGYWVDFFGRPASVHKAIALFALKYDALLVVGCTRRVGGPLEYELFASAMADPRSGRPEVRSPYQLTQWYTAELEKLIRLHPDQYWWLHDRWKPRRPGNQKARAA